MSYRLNINNEKHQVLLASNNIIVRLSIPFYYLMKAFYVAILKTNKWVYLNRELTTLNV